MATGKEILNDAKQKMAKSGDALQRTLADIRAGQANASLLNSVKVASNSQTALVIDLMA